MLAVAAIRTDGGTQTRASINEATVETYVEALSAGATFPPLVVFYDGRDHWLADGFHRERAYRRAGVREVSVDVRQGTRRDAILFSVGANDTHGLPRTNADKRRAVETLLRDEEWSKKSDRWIAERAGVSHTFVQNLRPQLATVASPSPAPPVREGRDGKVRKAPEAKPRPEASPPAAETAAEPIAPVVAPSSPAPASARSAARTARDAEMLRLRIEEGLSPSEIAERLGCSASTVQDWQKRTGNYDDSNKARATERAAKANPLARLTKAVAEACDTLDAALGADAARWSDAAPEHIEELTKHLTVLRRKATQLITRLNKEAASGDTNGNEVHQAQA